MTTTTLKDDSFVDPAIATFGITLWDRKDGQMTNAVQLLVRPTDMRGDESGGHPGEQFVMVTITREEVAAMLLELQRDFEAFVPSARKRGPLMTFLRQLLCRHKHGRLQAIEWDGTAVYECTACGKPVRKPL